eukprot:GHVU01158554.1.p2 GENE.GHVU01158554.1~~GHVU01158554.1.p2  ORF type:complete len:104 (-),score=4.47 GHVU01158554.1:443-754(-)
MERTQIHTYIYMPRSKPPGFRRVAAAATRALAGTCAGSARPTTAAAAPHACSSASMHAYARMWSTARENMKNTLTGQSGKVAKTVYVSSSLRQAHIQTCLVAD